MVPQGSQRSDHPPQLGSYAAPDASVLIPALRRYAFPPNVLPLARERQPFAELSEAMIVSVIRQALNSPTRKGRFTDAIRDLVGIRISTPASYSVVEAHIDLTDVTSELLDELLALGFEPDNFAEIQPPQYVRHFTIQHKIPRGAEDARDIFRDVHAAAQSAADVIARCSGINGYVETECYTTRRIMKLDPSSLNPSQLDSFPFNNATFVSLRVPNTDAEVGLSGYDTVEKRAADIHVKLSAQATSEHGEDRLERLLQEAHFYRIRSDAGNWMYSAHFSALDDANTAYDELTAFAVGAGGITSVMREVCTGLWRKSDWSLGVPRRAEVPPHLRRDQTVA